MRSISVPLELAGETEFHTRASKSCALCCETGGDTRTWLGGKDRTCTLAHASQKNIVLARLKVFRMFFENLFAKYCETSDGKSSWPERSSLLPMPAMTVDHLQPWPKKDYSRQRLKNRWGEEYLATPYINCSAKWDKISSWRPPAVFSLGWPKQQYPQQFSKNRSKIFASLARTPINGQAEFVGCPRWPVPLWRISICT